MSLEITIIMIASMALCATSAVETITWHMKTYSNSGNRAKVISNANIFLYSSRLFYFIFQISIAYIIEVRKEMQSVELVFLICYGLLILAHYLMLQKTFLRIFENKNSGSNGGKIEINVAKEIINKKTADEYKLIINVALSTFIFSMASLLPYSLVKNFPEYRLIFGSLIQIINFIGMMFVLFLIDRVLYAAMDDGVMPLLINKYVLGRLIGYSITFVMCLTLIII